jgi:hypothetical protein
MELYLQMGHGMQGMCHELTKLWGKSNVILSPVNILQHKLKSYVKKLKDEGANILFDPQFFYPVVDTRDKLKAYPYWPDDDFTVSNHDNCEYICQELLRINNDIGTKAIILPSPKLDDYNLEKILGFIDHTIAYFKNKTEKPLLGTLCLDVMTIRNSSKIEELQEVLKSKAVDGFYIIAHPSDNEYIISDPLWLIGMMKLLTCIKLAGKAVIVGYSNHQGLIYSAAKIDGLASGNFLNTRTFRTDRFFQREQEDMRRSIWYYNPYAMTEYKVSLLDVARKRG